MIDYCTQNQNPKHMTISKHFTVFFILFLLSSKFVAQSLELGITLGPTFAQYDVVAIDGDMETEIIGIDRGNGLPGYHANLFGGFSLNKYLAVRSELGYELLQISSGNGLFATAKIHQVSHTLSLGVSPITWWTLYGGLSTTGRSNSFKDNGFNTLPGLNGLEVQGFYWQTKLGTFITVDRKFEIGFQVTLPKIASVTRSFTFDAIDNRPIFIDEQLRGYRFSLGWLFFKEDKGGI